MSNTIIDKLFESLSSLRQAISETKKAVSEMEQAHPEILQRLSCYEEVLSKQNVLAETLRGHVERQDWEQVSRYVELIRGSSLLIQLDTQAIISELNTSETQTAREEYLD